VKPSDFWGFQDILLSKHKHLPLVAFEQHHLHQLELPQLPYQVQDIEILPNFIPGLLEHITPVPLIEIPFDAGEDREKVFNVLKRGVVKWLTVLDHLVMLVFAGLDGLHHQFFLNYGCPFVRHRSSLKENSADKLSFHEKGLNGEEKQAYTN
jgi:hypothetical protein